MCKQRVTSGDACVWQRWGCAQHSGSSFSLPDMAPVCGIVLNRPFSQLLRHSGSATSPVGEMAACLSRVFVPCGMLHHQRHICDLNVHKNAPNARPPRPITRRGVARRAVAPVAGAAATDSTAASCQSFEQLYAGLAGVLAPGGAVAARPTPLGRGLVAEQQVAKGDVLLSGKSVDALYAYVMVSAVCSSSPTRSPHRHRRHLARPCSGLVQLAVRHRPAQRNRQRFWAALPGGLADVARPPSTAAAALPASGWVARCVVCCCFEVLLASRAAIAISGIDIGALFVAKSSCWIACFQGPATKLNLCCTALCRRGRLVPAPGRLAAVAQAQRPGPLAPLHRPAAQGGRT